MSIWCSVVIKQFYDDGNAFRLCLLSFPGAILRRTSAALWSLESRPVSWPENELRAEWNWQVRDWNAFIQIRVESIQAEISLSEDCWNASGTRERFSIE